MNNAVNSAAILAVILLLAALIVVWVRRKSLLRALAIPLALLAAGASAGVVGSTLGHAVPLVAGITAPAGDVPMLSAKLVRGVGIYLTLDVPDAPRLYWIPWDKKMAEAIEEMLSDPGNAGVVATVPPFEFSWDRSKPSFQPIPQPKVLPDKPPEPPKAPSFAA